MFRRFDQKEVYEMSSSITSLLLGFNLGPLSKNKTFRAPVESLDRMKEKLEKLFNLLQIQVDDEISPYRIAQWSVELLSLIDLEDILSLLAANYHMRLKILGANGSNGTKTKYLTVRETMEELNIKSPQTIRNMIDDGRLTAIRPGREYQILRSSVEARQTLIESKKKPKVKRVD